MPIRKPSAAELLALYEEVRRTAGEVSRSPMWKPIKSVPKYRGKGDVPDKYMVWIYDPDARKRDRVQPVFWNGNYDGYQVLIESSDDPINPTHWMAFVPPAPPTK